MTLDEAIQHALEKAEGNCPCAADHVQLAGWLQELKDLRRGAELKEIPPLIMVEPTKVVKVVEKNLDGMLGCWDSDNATIFIHQDQPSMGKWIVLIHEMLHMIEDQLKGHGVIPGRVDHDFITCASSLLFGWMGMSGLLNGVRVEDALAFVEHMLAVAQEQDDEQTCRDHQ